jgi:hypothetical protein
MGIMTCGLPSLCSPDYHDPVLVLYTMSFPCVFGNHHIVDRYRNAFGQIVIDPAEQFLQGPGTFELNCLIIDKYNHSAFCFGRKNPCLLNNYIKVVRPPTCYTRYFLNCLERKTKFRNVGSRLVRPKQNSMRIPFCL